MSGRTTSRGPRSSREALGMAAPSSSAIADGAPPSLRTEFWSGMRLVLLMNIVPMLGLAWLAWSWHQGRVSLQRIGATHVVVMVAVVLACGIVAVSSWLVMPIARWLRDYPRWHFRHRGRVRWLLPTIGGFVCWLALCCACLLAIVAMVAFIGSGLWRLTHAR